jgi:hypothetical protein
MDIYGHLMKPVNNEEAVKLRATLFGNKSKESGDKNCEDGSKMVANSSIGRVIDK